MKLRSTGCCLLFMSAVTFATAGDKTFLREKTLELLDAYCTDGSRIVRLAMVNVIRDPGEDFTTMMTDAEDEQDCVNEINTIVHEENHGLNTFMGRVVLKERFGQLIDLFYEYDYFYLKNGRFTLVRRGDTFPSKEMVPTFPEHLITFRFDTYIDTDNALQSTQNEGIYGLVDEFNSYYLGTQASFDLLAYYEKKGADANWHDFFLGVNGTYYGCLEFRLYILKYLMFAKEHHPDIYRKILANRDLIHSFLAVDENVSDLMRSYFEKKPVLYERFKGYGWGVQEDENMLHIKKNGRNVGHTNFLGVYNLLNEEMKQPEYQNLVQSLIESARDWDSESVYRDIEKEIKGEEESDESCRDECADKESNEEDPDEDTDRPIQTFSGMANLDDPVGDAKPSFIDLEKASILKEGDGLAIRIRLAHLSDRLIFNQPKVSDDVLEYDWSCYVDLDGDGEDDFSLGFSNYKFAGNKTVRGEIVDHAQLSLWKLEGDGATQVDVSLRGERKGNELVVRVPKGSFVSRIEKKTQFHFQTFYNDGSNTSEDRMPD